MRRKKPGRIARLRKTARRTERGLAVVGALAIAEKGYQGYRAAERYLDQRAVQAKREPTDLRLPQGKPSISTPTINAILANGPMAGQGKLIFQMAKKHNVDPAFALGFFRLESSFCSKGLGEKNNNPGNIKVVKTYRNKKGEVKRRIQFGKFESIGQGIEAWFRLIARDKNYYRAGKYHLEPIVEVYAPRSENVTDVYIANVRASVKQYRAMEKQGSPK